MIAQVVTQLVSVLKDDTIGLNVEAQAVATANSVTIPTLLDNEIYGTDAPVRPEDVDRGLALTPLATRVSQVRHQSQGIRDAVHTIGFEFGTDEPDEAEWRALSMYMAEALMRVLDKFNSNNASYAGSCGVIVVDGWSVDYAAQWRLPPNALRGFAMQAEIQARDTF